MASRCILSRVTRGALRYSVKTALNREPSPLALRVRSSL